MAIARDCNSLDFGLRQFESGCPQFYVHIFETVFPCAYVRIALRQDSSKSAPLKLGAFHCFPTGQILSERFRINTPSAYSRKRASSHYPKFAFAKIGGTLYLHIFAPRLKRHPTGKSDQLGLENLRLNFRLSKVALFDFISLGKGYSLFSAEECFKLMF